MRRTLIVLPAIAAAAAFASRTARAEALCTPAAVDDSLRALAVELTDSGDAGGPWSATLAATSTSQFPAVSEDGHTIVELYADQQDFIGTPIATVVFYGKRGQVASYQLTSGERPADRAQQRAEATTVAAINKRLARSKWRALPVGGACADDDASDLSHLDLGDGVRVAFDFSHQQLTVEHGGRKTTARFPAPGNVIDRDLPRGGCGGIAGLDRIFGSRKIGFVVVEPRVNLGGDSCMGSPIADVAITVRVP